MSAKKKFENKLLARTLEAENSEIKLGFESTNWAPTAHGRRNFLPFFHKAFPSGSWWD
jgi:hypothetical protein